MNTEFPPSVPVGREPSPEGRGARPACHDGNLKCSVIWGIVRLNKNKTIPMTEQDKANIFDIVIKPFLCPDSNHESQGTGNLFAEAIRTLINTALLAQRDAHLGCEQYQRSTDRNGQRNGFKHRTVRTSTGKITLDVPQVRNSETPFRPLIPGFEQGKRVDRALNLAIAEMYLQGVSTRKVAKVMQEICGDNGVSSSYVSQCTSQLDELFEKWRTRQLPPIAHLFLDATYTKVRLNGVIVDCAVFVAVGIDAETGRRMVLGVSVERSEAAAHWTTFIQSLLMRGMNRPLTVTSDDHTGIRAALARTLTGVLWQRCQFHLQQNAQSYVTNSRYKTIAAAHIRSIFNAGSRKMANIMLTNVLAAFRADGQDQLADWLTNNIEECLTIIDCPPEVQKRLRTSNVMESINSQLKRRTNVISIFPSKDSLLRIVTDKALDLSDEWEGINGKAYISPENLQLTAKVLKAASSQPKNSAT
ncbi:MAG: IS256 family transposase [Akkermansia sp.]